MNFFVELSFQIKKLFPFKEDGIFAKLMVLDPKIASNIDKSKSPTSIIIVPLAVHFPLHL